MSLDMVSFDAALKEHYTDQRVENMVYKDNPLLALLPKYEEFGGRNLPIPLIYGNPQNRSATFSYAISGVTNSLLDQFTLTRVKDYSIATIDNETLEASKGSENAFMEAATTEIDGCIQSLTRSTAIAIYGTGFGSIGNVSAPGASTTLTLTNPNDITNFEAGMVLVFATAEATGTLLGAPDTLTVVAVDRSAGTMTVNANVNTVTGIANGDFIFPIGDRQNVVTPAAIKISGLKAWIPAATPSATPFFGVNRTIDATRLGGMRYAGTGVPLEEALIEGASRVAREGGKIDHYFLNYKQYAALEKSLGSKVQYIDLKVNAEVGFRGIVVSGPRGPINVIPDQNCPSGSMFGLQLDTWKLYTLGKAIRVIDTDGLQMLRQASADGVEVRYGMYGNLGCRGPGFNIHITTDA